MTTEEAIKRLEKLKAIYSGMDIKSDIEALDMAIKGLEALCTNGCEYCEYTECPLAQEESEEEE